MTLEQREEVRAKIRAKHGAVNWTISEATRDAIAAEVAQNWTVLSEEFTGHRLTFYVNPKVSGRKLLDAEGELCRYGNPPHCPLLATDFTAWRLTFIAV